jgi:single-strand DNA-binding protein
MNQCQFVGRLTADPEVRYTKTGKAVASFTLAVNRNAYSSQREPNEKEPADFVPIVAWEKLAEMTGNNLAKGSRVFVQGRLQIRSYETQDGQKRRVSEIVADIIAPNFEIAKDNNRQQPPQADAKAAFGGREVFPPEEEIPF